MMAILQVWFRNPPNPFKTRSLDQKVALPWTKAVEIVSSASKWVQKGIPPFHLHPWGAET